MDALSKRHLTVAIGGVHFITLFTPHHLFVHYMLYYKSYM